MHPPLVSTHQVIKMVHMHFDAAESDNALSSKGVPGLLQPVLPDALSWVLNLCLQALGLLPRNG